METESEFHHFGPEVNVVPQMDAQRPTGGRLTPITIDEARVCVARIASELGRDNKVFDNLLKLAHMRCVIVNRVAQHCYPGFPSILDWAAIRMAKLSEVFSGKKIGGRYECLEENRSRYEPKFRAKCFPCGTMLPGRKPRSVWVVQQKGVGGKHYWDECCGSTTGLAFAACNDVLKGLELESMDTETDAREYWMTIGDLAAEWGKAIPTPTEAPSADDADDSGGGDEMPGAGEMPWRNKGWDEDLNPIDERKHDNDPWDNPQDIDTAFRPPSPSKANKDTTTFHATTIRPDSRYDYGGVDY